MGLTVPVVASADDLGVQVTASTRRVVATMRKRAAKADIRARRVIILGKRCARAVKLVRTGAIPAMRYGAQATGIAPSTRAL